CLRSGQRFVSGPYSEHVNPWMDAALRRATGLKIDPRDLIRVMKVSDLSITCAMSDDHISFCLMRGNKMFEAIKLERVKPADFADVQADLWESVYEWLFPCLQK